MMPEVLSSICSDALTELQLQSAKTLSGSEQGKLLNYFMLLDSEGEKFKIASVGYDQWSLSHPLSPVTSSISVWYFLISNLLCFTPKTK